jgi:hypothetical protein
MTVNVTDKAKEKILMAMSTSKFRKPAIRLFFAGSG